MLAPNGLRYLRWGGDGEAVQLEKTGRVLRYLAQQSIARVNWC